MFIFDNTDAPKHQATITLNGGVFSLFLDHPSVADRLANDALTNEHYLSTGQQKTEAYQARYLRRLNLVTGWTGVVNKAGTPIPFDRSALLKLLAKNPNIVDQLGPHFGELYSTKDSTVGEPVASPGDSQNSSTMNDAA